MKSLHCKGYQPMFQNYVTQQRQWKFLSQSGWHYLPSQATFSKIVFSIAYHFAKCSCHSQWTRYTHVQNWSFQGLQTPTMCAMCMSPALWTKPMPISLKLSCVPNANFGATLAMLPPILQLDPLNWLKIGSNYTTQQCVQVINITTWVFFSKITTPTQDCIFHIMIV